MELKPKKFYIAKGKGTSKISEINAFDRALHDAGISQYNLVPVSSMIPMGAERVEPITLDPGAIVFTVMAHKSGGGGKIISAGLKWGFTNKGYGMVVEGCSEGPRERTQRKLDLMLEDMAATRGVEVVKEEMEIEEVKIPLGYYGSVIVAMIFIL
ncbi:pyruvoyl-dependent arginine decarboxylase [Candidatus Bathyarchaeota archaeon ex4484_205]|nr:MAG: pyruvoyl-dependent arginine decarboxylase [Candidatus Bathyarchaeota archaeon ex4484_205]